MRVQYIYFKQQSKQKDNLTLFIKKITGNKGDLWKRKERF